MLQGKPFDRQPTLIGRYVTTRPLRPADEQLLYAVASDPLIWAQHPADRHEEAEFKRFFAESLATGGALLVTDAVTNAVIGSSRYHGYNADDSSVEIGWTFLARSYWGGQHNGELKQLMLVYAFNFVDTVLLYVDVENKRSQRAVEKIGGVKDSALDEQGRVVFRIPAARYR